MSRKAILSTLAGAVVLAIGAVSAQAAPMPKAPAGSVLNKGGVVEQAHYRHHRH